MTGMRPIDKFFAGAVVLFVVAAPLVSHPLFAMQVLCFALFAAAFNLVAGYLGLISFGHAAFFGLGAYVSGWIAKALGWPTELAILAGVAATTLLGVVFGFLAIRRQGVYFAMITLALSQLVFFACHQASFTGGEDGIAGIPRGKLFGMMPLSPNYAMYGFVLAVTGIGFFVIRRAVRSPFGLVLQAIRDDEKRAISLGYDVDRVKLLAFVLSAGLTGLAGATKAIVFQFASQTDIVWSMSGVPVLACLIGGIGTLAGPLIGAAMMVSLDTSLAWLGEWVLFVQGAIFVLVVSFFRHGLWGEIVDRFSGQPAETSRSAPDR
jgi:branched-chain amino acid transport system permease protein